MMDSGCYSHIEIEKRTGHVMKRQMKPIIWFLTLLALLTAPHLASAYYDPGVQRWINRDPIGTRGGVNLYGFVRNRPLGVADRDGRLPIDGPPPPDRTPQDEKNAKACSCYYNLWKQRNSIMGRA